jgi:hypothetical protein
MFKFEKPGRKFWGGFLAGTLWGVALTFIAGTLYLRHSLLREYECVGDLPSCVEKIKANVGKAQPWTVQTAGCFAPLTPEGAKIEQLRFCNSNYVRMLVANPDERKIAAVLPCAAAIYTKPDGKAYMARLNMPLLTRILGGTPAFLFSEKIAPEQRYIMNGVLKGR